MPTYNFQRLKNHKPVKQYQNMFMTITEMEQFLIDNPDLELAPSNPYYGDVVRQGLKKPSDGFRDVLRAIKRRHRGSTINTF